ncbi:hypothetical protein HDU84_007461 [Entophlyctis sp. JEL0112]|nr:hypothetical protein HDU84_007461 [Entophlyctis sp. JEL0112]
MSPELVSETSYNTKSDIWALGRNFHVAEFDKSQASISIKDPSRVDAEDSIGPHRKSTATSEPFLNISLTKPGIELFTSFLSAVFFGAYGHNKSDHMKRPSTTEFLKSPRIRLVIKERSFNADCKRREEELKHRESLLETREAQVALREEEVRQKLKEIAASACMCRAIEDVQLPDDRPLRGIKQSNVAHTDEDHLPGDDASSVTPHLLTKVPELTSKSAPSTVRSSISNVPRIEGAHSNAIVAEVPQKAKPIAHVGPKQHKTVLSGIKAPLATSPSPLRSGIQLRTQQHAAIYGGLVGAIGGSGGGGGGGIDGGGVGGSAGLAVGPRMGENRAPLTVQPPMVFGIKSAAVAYGGYERVAMRAVADSGTVGSGSGRAFRSGMTPSKTAVSVGGDAGSVPASPMQLSSP